MDKERQMSLHGLPPLPKSLAAAVGGSSAASSVTHSNTASPLNHLQHGLVETNELFLGPSTSAAARGVNPHRTHRHGSLSSTQESLSDRESLHSRNSTASHSSHHTPTNNNALSIDTVGNGGAESDGSTTTLDTQLAILRREMYGLRQLDLSLLSQLWALNESIQGFRVFLQEQEILSPPSPSSPSDTNSISSEPEDESYAAPTKLPMQALQQIHPIVSGSTGGSHASTSSASGASGSSSAASSMGKHRPAPPPPTQRAHPQLPRILQQRMRHAPPPPPPTRSKPNSNSPIALSKPPSQHHRPV